MLRLLLIKFYKMPRWRTAIEEFTILRNPCYHALGGMLQAWLRSALGFDLASLGLPQGIVKNSAFVA